MKKIILYIYVIVLLTGCSFDNGEVVNKINNDDVIVEDIPNEDIYIDDNPIKVSLYEGANRINNYSTILANFKDIGVFNVYFTDIDKLDGVNIKSNYQKYLKQYDNIDNYEIGFYVSFFVEDKKIEEVILDPSSKHAMTPYLYVYLYDDINQIEGTYYSHLEPEDMSDETVFSSIKLFLAQQGVEITSPITLTVFTYNGEDDFDENGIYRGNSSYTINIDTK